MLRLTLISLFIIVVIGSTFAVAIPTNSNAGRIVGGQETTITKYPYQVSIRLDSSVLLHICGGSVYAPRVIVTAAHCIKGRFASTIRIVAGSTTIADTTDTGLRVIKLIPHSGYNKKTHANDVGLIILAEDLIYSQNIQPISLASEYPAAGSWATITGWGKREEDATTLTNLLQVADVEIVERSICDSKYLAKNYAITEEMVCAGIEAGGKDACQGDSGGPLAVDGKLVGIVSWGIGCAREGFPGVYASTSYHANWIEESAKPYL